MPGSSMAGPFIHADEVKRLQVDPLMAGARIALLCDGVLHVSPAMFAALRCETEETWRSLRVVPVPSVKDLANLKVDDPAGLQSEFQSDLLSGFRAEFRIEWPGKAAVPIINNQESL